MRRLGRTIVKVLIPVLLIFAGARYVYGDTDGTAVNTNDILNSNQTQNQNTYGPGYSNAVTVVLLPKVVMLMLFPTAAVQVQVLLLTLVLHQFQTSNPEHRHFP